MKHFGVHRRAPYCKRSNRFANYYFAFEAMNFCLKRYLAHRSIFLLVEVAIINLTVINVALSQFAVAPRPAPRPYELPLRPYEPNNVLPPISPENRSSPLDQYLSGGTLNTFGNPSRRLLLEDLTGYNGIASASSFQIKSKNSIFSEAFKTVDTRQYEAKGAVEALRVASTYKNTVDGLSIVGPYERQNILNLCLSKNAEAREAAARGLSKTLGASSGRAPGNVEKNDIVQDMLVKIISKCGLLVNVPEILLPGYVRKMLKNFIIDQYRAVSIQSAIFTEIAEEEKLNNRDVSTSHMGNVEARDLFNKALKILTLRQSEVLRLTLMGFDRQEISDELCISLERVKEIRADYMKKFRKLVPKM